MITVVAGRAVPAYLFLDIDMSFCEALRKKFKAIGSKVTITAMLLKCIAIAQRAHPASRTIQMFFGKRAVLNEIVAGFTVERLIDSKPAVFFGAIESPDTKSLEQISQELQAHSTYDLSDINYLKKQDWFNRTPYLFRQIILWLALRLPALRLNHMKATFGLSSLGKLGMKAIIPPCASTSTFGVGEVEKRAVVRDNQIEIRPMMSITLIFDHRIVDGAPAARFLNDIRTLMEGELAQYLDDSQIPPIQTLVPSDSAAVAAR